MQEHDEGLQRIINNPKIISDNIVFLAKEPRIYGIDGRLIGEPDILALDKYNRWKIVEYKCSIEKKKSADSKLKIYLRQLKDAKIVDHAELIFMYGNMKKVSL